MTNVDLPRAELLAGITDAQFLSALAGSSEPLSRAEIAVITSISKPSMSQSARRLSEKGLIVTIGKRIAGKGGVATLFALNPDFSHSVALDVALRSISVRVTAFDRSTLFESRVNLEVNDEAAHVINVAQKMLDQASALVSSPRQCVAVSIANPIDMRTGGTAPLPNSAFPAGRFTPHRDLNLNTPLVLVDNDVNWATIAAHDTGVAQGLENFIYVYIGDGIGAGLFIDGAVRRGSHGLAGEIGFIKDESGQDLTQRLAGEGFGRETSYGLDTLAMLSALSAADHKKLDAGIENVAHNIVNMATLLDPEAIVLGGALTEKGYISEMIAAQIEDKSISEIDVLVGKFSPLEGAAAAAHAASCKSVGF